MSEGATIAIAAVGSGTQLSGLQALPFVDRALALARPYRQVGREARRADTVVRIGSVPIGGEHFAAIAGPCAVESESQLRAIATIARARRAARSCAAAPTSRAPPYSFQGLGEEGLDILPRRGR